jgi:hypothetical protein
MALGIKGETLHSNLEYGKQVQPQKKKKKNKKTKMIKRVQILEPSHCIQIGTSKIQRTKSVTQKKGHLCEVFSLRVRVPMLVYIISIITYEGQSIRDS